MDVDSEPSTDRAVAVLAALRGDRPTHVFVDDLLKDPSGAWTETVRQAVPATVDLARAMKSEADRLAMILAAASIAPLTIDDRRLLFDTLYILWRFGGTEARGRATEEGQRLLSVSEGHVLGQLHLKLGLLALDPAVEEDHIAAARRLGVPIPRRPGDPDPAATPPDRPSPDYRLELAVVDGTSRRAFSPPRGDDWHPAFDLAATHLPELFRVSIPGGVLSVDTTAGRPSFYVHDAEGRLIPELSAGDHPFMEPPVRIAGTLALLDDWHSAFNVCHALFDKVTRLGAYPRAAGFGLSAVTFVQSPWYVQMLRSLDVEPVFPSSPRWSVSADTLVMLSNHRRGGIMHPAFSAAPHALDFIRDRLQAARPGHRRLYISRRDTTIRVTLNEDEVEALFVAAGFEIHQLSGLTVDAQKALFQQASHIAGMHGAGLANLAFAHPSTRVLEMMPPNNGSFAYWVMASALGMDYWLHVVEDAVLDMGPGAGFDMMLNTRDCRVDASRLEAVLRDFAA